MLIVNVFARIPTFKSFRTSVLKAFVRTHILKAFARIPMFEAFTHTHIFKCSRAFLFSSILLQIAPRPGPGELDNEGDRMRDQYRGAKRFQSRDARKHINN